MPPLDIATRRHRLGLSQPELARAFGVPLATWRNWEHGRTAMPWPEMLDCALRCLEAEHHHVTTHAAKASTATSAKGGTSVTSQTR